ncbi:MAG: nodulation protein NfeD [Myxococcales bacterium]|nr:nodulation protein NfeD [Myxococcales bacterium]
MGKLNAVRWGAPVVGLLVGACLSFGAAEAKEVGGSAEGSSVSQTDLASADTGAPASTPEEGAGDEAQAPRIPTADVLSPPPALFEDGGAPATALVIDISGEISPATASYVERALRDAAGAGLIVLRVDTFGGRIDAAVRIRDALLESDVPTVAYVPHRAISAGALISLAAQSIVFGPGASMGAATPIQIEGGEAAPVEDKVVSYMRAEMRATAEARGRRTDVAEAMVDASVAIDGVIDDETLLTLTTREAAALGVIDGVVDSEDELFAALGAASTERVGVELNWAERLAGFLTSPVVAGILMSIGMLGVMIELYHPGVALPGVVGVLALSAFFFGHAVVALAGWEEVALLLVGFVLLALELFVIPGFGIAGILGIACVAGALLLSMVDGPLDVAVSAGAVNAGARTLFFALVLAIGAAFAIGKLLPERAYPSWLVLRTTIAQRAGAAAPPETVVGVSVSPGDRGRTLTPLKPAGKVRFAGDVVDVVSRGPWVEAGVEVAVVEVGGVRVVVEEVESPNEG